jgi:hypothetical protein
MSQVYLGIAIAEIAIAVLLMVRLAAGPTISDRILVVGGWLAWAHLRTRGPRVITGLRAIHTGSANDYAGYAIAGTLAVITVLSLG